MSYRSVVLVTTLSCALARIAGTNTARARTAADARARKFFSMFSILHDKGAGPLPAGSSERMWLMWTQSEARLQQDPVEPLPPRRPVALIRRDQLPQTTR